MFNMRQGVPVRTGIRPTFVQINVQFVNDSCVNMYVGVGIMECCKFWRVGTIEGFLQRPFSPN